MQPPPPSSILRIKDELNILVEQQSRALENAIYLGMTPDEDAQCDERLKKINELVRQLDELGL